MVVSVAGFSRKNRKGLSRGGAWWEKKRWKKEGEAGLTPSGPSGPVSPLCFLSRAVGSQEGSRVGSGVRQIPVPAGPSDQSLGHCPGPQYDTGLVVGHWVPCSLTPSWSLQPFPLPPASQGCAMVPADEPGGGHPCPNGQRITPCLPHSGSWGGPCTPHPTTI